MKVKVVTFAAITFFCAAAMSAQQPSNQLQGQRDSLTRYKVIDLGTFGTAFSIAQGINDKGWIAGVFGDQNQHEFVWRKGVVTDLGTLGGPNSGVGSFGQMPNQRGQIVGAAESSDIDPLAEGFCNFWMMSPPTNNVCLPFVWQNGVMKALPTLGGTNGGASEINNRGQAVGAAENTDFFPGCSTPHLSFQPVIWENGAIRQLPTVGGDPGGSIDAINERGQAVGATGNCTTSFHAVLWEKGVAKDLGNLGGTSFFEATAINDSSQVVGFSDLPGDATFHAFLWQDGSISDLGTLPGDDASFASAINNRGQIVGTSCVDAFCTSSTALLWKDGNMFDLNDLIVGSKLYLAAAVGINNRGQITGYTADFHGFLATPCADEHANEEQCVDPQPESGAANRHVLKMNLQQSPSVIPRPRIGHYPRVSVEAPMK